MDCSVYAPPEARPAESLLVQVFAHLPEQAEAVGQVAREFDDAAQRRGFQSLELEVRRGDRLTFHLSLPGLEVDDPVQSLVWRGVPRSVQFGVDVPAGHGSATVIGTVIVSLRTVPIGHIKFKLTIGSLVTARSPRGPEPAGDEAGFYRQAFISYARQDIGEVLKRVQMLAGLGIAYRQDLFHIQPGQAWEEKLYRFIDESDLFLLFWSSAARQSEWVRKELSYALGRKSGNTAAPPEILPIAIEGPPPPDPPDELKHLYFADPLLYFMPGLRGHAPG